jgi:hypothetical protein
MNQTKLKNRNSFAFIFATVSILFFSSYLMPYEIDCVLTMQCPNQGGCLSDYYQINPPCELLCGLRIKDGMIWRQVDCGIAP